MSGNTVFVPLTLDLIEEGNLLHDANTELAKLQSDLRRFVEEHGPKAKGQVAELTIKIKVKAEDPENDWYSIKSEMTRKHPPRPACITKGMAGISQDGERVIFVRRSGSDTNDPRQMKLATSDGRTVVGGEAEEYPDE